MKRKHRTKGKHTGKHIKHSTNSKGLESAETIKAIPKAKDLAYSCPPHPDSPNYEIQLAQLEQQLAQSEQIHTCTISRCLVLDKKTQSYKCKRRAPFPCSTKAFVDENENWGSERHYGFVNGWIPSILVNMWCNNDGKLLTNGEDTKNIAMYVTKYASKNQGKSFQLSAVMADSYAYHLNHPRINVADLQDQQHLLLFCLVHAINREQELAAVMVMSYLMGWGDVYCSHHYSPVYWSSFIGALLKFFPELSSLPQHDNLPSGEQNVGERDQNFKAGVDQHTDNIGRENEVQIEKVRFSDLH
jgi:hypothetical protein